MPQTFQVLRCYKCMVFQVHQTKKSNKWVCKLCGEKQTVKRHYGLGTAKDCRLHVQRLNGIRGDIDESKGALDDEISTSTSSIDSEVLETQTNTKISKWSNFVEEAKETMELKTLGETLVETNNTLDGLEVVLEVPKKKKKVNNIRANRNKNCLNVQSYESKLTDKNNETPTCIIKRDVPSRNITHPNFVKNKNEVKIETTAHKVESKNKIKEPLVKKNTEYKVLSKWDQYVEDKVDNIDEENDDEPQNMNTCTKQVHTNKNTSRNETVNLDYKGITFSLCDDEDIDQVLNF